MLKIIWLVDGFVSDAENEEDRVLCISVLKTLRNLSKTVSLRVEPIHFVAPDSMALNFEMNPSQIKQGSIHFKKKLEEIWDPEDQSFLADPKIVLDLPSGSPATMEKHPLIRHVESENVDLIVMGSHARSGFTRLVRGSFAEKFFNYSPVPVLVVGAKAVVPEEFKEVVFPTDFSGESVRCFELVVLTARALKAQLKIFHRKSNSSGEGLSEVQTKKCSEALIRKAREMGVEAQCLIDQSGAQTLPVAIARAFGEKQQGIIVMGTDGSPESPRYQEGITRRVIEEATSPVWIYQWNSSPETIEKIARSFD